MSAYTQRGFPGRFEPAVHGHEPHQAVLGPHPATDYVGYLDDPQAPSVYTLNARDATAGELATEWISADPEYVEDLEVWR